MSLTVELTPADPPHVRLRSFRRQEEAALLIALAPMVLASAILFGPGVLLMYLGGMAAAAAGDWLGHRLLRRTHRVRRLHAVGVGALVAAVLPASAGVLIAAVGGFVGALVGRLLRDGWGRYPWHPALVGWVFCLLVFPQAAAPPTWPVGGSSATGPRPVDVLARHYATDPVAFGDASPRTLRSTALYALPPWPATVWGRVAGGIGSVSAAALLAGGLWLVFLGHLRWQSPVCALLAAGVTAAIWPIHADGGPIWFPIACVQDGFAVGATLVLYHLTGGSLLLACCLLAADPISTPLNVRGHAMFGAGVGVLTVGMRAVGVAPGAALWAVLAMNTLAPAIDRVTRRRVYGASPVPPARRHVEAAEGAPIGPDAP